MKIQRTKNFSYEDLNDHLKFSSEKEKKKYWVNRINGKKIDKATAKGAIGSGLLGAAVGGYAGMSTGDPMISAVTGATLAGIGGYGLGKVIKKGLLKREYNKDPEKHGKESEEERHKFIKSSNDFVKDVLLPRDFKNKKISNKEDLEQAKKDWNDKIKKTADSYYKPGTESHTKALNTPFPKSLERTFSLTPKEAWSLSKYNSEVLRLGRNNVYQSKNPKVKTIPEWVKENPKKSLGLGIAALGAAGGVLALKNKKKEKSEEKEKTFSEKKKTKRTSLRSVYTNTNAGLVPTTLGGAAAGHFYKPTFFGGALGAANAITSFQHGKRAAERSNDSGDSDSKILAKSIASGATAAAGGKLVSDAIMKGGLVKRNLELNDLVAKHYGKDPKPGRNAYLKEAAKEFLGAAALHGAVTGAGVGYNTLTRISRRKQRDKNKSEE